MAHLWEAREFAKGSPCSFRVVKAGGGAWHFSGRPGSLLKRDCLPDQSAQLHLNIRSSVIVGVSPPCRASASVAGSSASVSTHNLS